MSFAHTAAPGGPTPDVGLPASGAIGVGAAGGLVGALVGGGTGLLAVPVLDRLTGLRRASIHGTTTIANVAVAAVGTTVYGVRGGAVDLAVGLPLAAGGLVGAVAGARLAARAPDTVLRSVFVVVLVMSGAMFLIDAVNRDWLGGAAMMNVSGTVGDAVPGVVAATVIGVVVGGWSSALGLGGGLLAVPVLVFGFGVPLHAAQGTSLMVMLPNSVIGAATHLRQRTASGRLGALLAVGAAAGAGGGALLALSLSTRTIGGIFGVFALIMAVRELHRLVPRTRGRGGDTR